MRKVKKKKLSYRKLSYLIVPLILIIGLIVFRKNLLYFYQSKTTGYPVDTIAVFHESNIYDDIKKHNYSTTLDKIIKTDYYNKKYVNEYLDINYIDTKNFLNDINTLLNLGYSSKDINSIYKSLKTESITLLLKNDYLKDIANILDLSYFHEDYLNRYLTYNKKKDLSSENLITYVNIGLDKDYYTDVEEITDLDNLQIIVNKYHALPSSYIPKDLEAISNKYNKGYNNKMRHTARIAFEEMCEAALKDNITIYSGSAYRSYNYQLNLYNRYVNQDGKKVAETYAARAGYSEHQTGLATDIMNAKLEFISLGDKEYDWLVDNSYKYGFNLRYPKEKEDITGYMYEEWHYRYVGKEIAKYLYDNDITYDEYVARNY